MRVKIFGSETEEFHFDSTMPVLPKKGEFIGFWVDKDKDKEWVVAEVLQLVYEFDKSNKFECVEITVFA